MPSFSVSLEKLACHLSAQLNGDPQAEVMGIAPLDKAQAGHISFLHTPQYRAFLNTTQATAVILSPKDAPAYAGNSLVMENPYLGYAKAASLFLPKLSLKAGMGVHTSAVVGRNCHIAPSASIGAHCVIADDVRIGEGAIIGPGCSIGDRSCLGDNAVVYAQVTIYHDVHIGDRAIIHSGAVIGADGFGMVNDKGIWHKIPQLGGVRIGHDVEVGANTAIDRGALEDTVIEDGVKLDNLIQIAHNVRIGAHTALAGGVQIAGSTQIGKYCMIGGGSAINGHIQITDKVILTGKTQVFASITQPGVYSSGMPSQPSREWLKNITRFAQLDQIVRRLKKLEKNNL